MPTDKMSNSPYSIRNYRPEDLDRYALLFTEAEKTEPTGHCVSPQAIAERLEQPNYSPEQDLFVVKIDGDIIGYIDIKPEVGIERVILDCWVHPEHRRRGLATGLLNYAMRRAKDLEAKVVHVNIPEKNTVAKKALSRLGFHPVRRFSELMLDMADVRWPDTSRVAPNCRSLKRGEEDNLTQIQNRAFAGHWGYNPNTVEEVTYRTNLSGCSPKDVVLACDGDKIVGFCWTRVAGVGGVADERKGLIHMIGSDPDYRGRGVGKKVLLAGLAHLKNKGVKVVVLSMDSENKAAFALYRSAGFKVQTGTLWYEKVVN